jgi:periplasmic protein CpxP/Spy
MNRTNWKLSACALLLAASSCAVWAQSGQQDAPPPGDGPRSQMRGAPGPEREVAHLTQILNLTADQQKGVRSVLEQQGEQMRALRNKTTGDAAASETPDARRAQMQQVRDESDTKIAALLDDTQKKTFADWISRRKAMMERREGQAPPAGNPPSPPPNQ